jgi:hypothetical protein
MGKRFMRLPPPPIKIWVWRHACHPCCAENINTKIAVLLGINARPYPQNNKSKKELGVWLK